MGSTTLALPDELALVTRAVVEPAAFAVLYDHYFSRVYNYVRYRVQDADVTDDIVAQVFERALTHIGSYRPERAPFAAWLFAIARHAVNDHLRAQRRHRWLKLEVVRAHTSGELQPEEAAVESEMRTALLASLACLNERERDLIALKFAAGLTNRRIAELTGLSEGNVGVILYRAVRRLRAALSDY